VSGGLQEGDLVSLTILNDALPGMPVQINKRTSTLRGEKLMEAAGAQDAAPAEQSLPDQSYNGESGSEGPDRVTAA
jgi:hypothetical protein